MILPEKLNRAQFNFVRKLAKYGIGPNDSEFEVAWIEEGLAVEIPVQVNRTVAMQEAERKLNDEREAELVLSFLLHHRAVSIRPCKNCKSDFGTNYNFQRYCSDLCRADALRQRGIEWNIEKSEDERWAGQAPSTIRPETLVKLRDWARRLLNGDETVDVPTEKEPELEFPELVGPGVKELRAIEALAPVNELLETKLTRLARRAILSEYEADELVRPTRNDEYVAIPVNVRRNTYAPRHAVPKPEIIEAEPEEIIESLVEEIVEIPTEVKPEKTEKELALEAMRARFSWMKDR